MYVWSRGETTAGGSNVSRLTIEENKKTAFLEIIVIEETHVTLFISPPRQRQRRQSEGRKVSFDADRAWLCRCTVHYTLYIFFLLLLLLLLLLYCCCWPLYSSLVFLRWRMDSKFLARDEKLGIAFYNSRAYTIAVYYSNEGTKTNWWSVKRNCFTLPKFSRGVRE